MNERQRFLETMTFGQPDHIPLDPGGPRESTLAAWHKQGLPEGEDWRTYLWDLLGIPLEPAGPQPGLEVNFRMLPSFEEQVLEHLNGHYIVQDWMGAIVEISDCYDYTYLRTAKDFVTRKWHRFPVQNRQDWIEKIRWRYDLHHPERFPADADIEHPSETRCLALRDRQHVLRLDFNGPFWQMREWCGLENLCIFMVEQPEFVQEMADFWMEFVLQVLALVLKLAAPDHVQVSEDMAYKRHSMISPVMARRFLLPVWKTWINILQAGGCGVVTMDSDGYVAELLPLWVEAGFAGTWPVEVAAGNDLLAYRQQYGRSLAYGGGIDKRALAVGGETMYAELQRVAPVIREGGYIPGCDHGVPADVSWPNFVAYTRRLAQLTGWV